MIAVQNSCLPPEQIEKVLAGALPPEEFDSAIVHMDDCDRCRSVAESIQQDGRWMIDAVRSDHHDPLQSETACQIALWKLLETPLENLPALEPAPERQTLGPYRLIRTLGVGGMGTVFLAKHERLDRDCAIKVLPLHRVNQPGWLDRFDREMRTVASLEHPNVVRATDAGHEDGWHYLVMEYLDGLDVGRVASRIGPIEVADASEIVRQAALGLAHVHRAGLVHRDVKPSNLMLTDGQVKLLDLGLVLAGDDPLGVDDRLTTVGHLMGTLPYMAPEQLADSSNVDPRADIYSLGATLFRLIAGRPPHQRQGGLAANILAITGQDAPSLESVRKGVEGQVVSLVSEMLDRDPANRPDSADLVAERLSQLSRMNQGTPSRLKSLLREAKRRPGCEESQPTSLVAAGIDANEPPGRSIRNWVMGGSMAAAMIVAGFIIKFQTDRGELVIHSERNDITIAIKQDEKMVDQLRIEAGSENRTVLRKGTYRIEIKGGGKALKLSDEVVTIERGREALVNVIETRANPGGNQHSTGEKLFQGNDLEHWMQSLEREQDVLALRTAIEAIETLSTDTEDRKKAAFATLKTARQWGDIHINYRRATTKPEHPRQQFMGILLRAFPDYLPEPGVDAIQYELTHGNWRSQLASVWILNNFLSGTFGIKEIPEERHAMTLQWISRTNDTSDGSRQLRSLIEAVGEYAKNVRGDSVEDQRGFNWAFDCGLILVEQMGIPVTDVEWLIALIREGIEKKSLATESDINDPSTATFNTYIQWAAACQIAFEDKNEAFVTLAITKFARAHIYLPPTQDFTVFALLKREYPQVLFEKTETVLREMCGLGTKANSKPLKVEHIAYSQGFWSEAIGFYAETTETPSDSLELLIQIKQLLWASSAARSNFGNSPLPLTFLNDAITKLKKRVADEE